MKCLSCKTELKSRWQNKYCSNKCQMDYQYLLYIKDWKVGKRDGNKGLVTRNLSKHPQAYLIEKYDEKCSLCGWKKQNVITGRVPLEVDHIDGNAENNLEKNLRLICPNCHSLTSNFKNLNKGFGRMWRTKKYLKNKSM